MKKKVLIVRLSSLGDVIFNLPLAAAFKKNGYKVTWITSEKGIDIIKNNPHVDEAILVPLKKWKQQKFSQNFKEYLEILKHIRSKKFDVAVDTQLLIKSFIWMIFSGAKRRIVATSAREFSFLGGNEIIKSEKDPNSVHAISQYLKYAEYLKLDINNLQPAMPPTTVEAKEKINNLLEGLDFSKPILTIAPATTWDTKHWNKNYWKTLIPKLEKDFTIVFTGTKNDIELIDYISEGKHLNLAGKTNLLELIELFHRTDLLLSLDSGSTHLAWASGKPKIVSIFCSTPPTRYAPIGAEDKYIALSGNLSCQYCHKKKCPLKTNECTFSPSVEEVLEAVYKLMPLNKI